MKVDVRSLSSHLASLAWVAFRSFAATLFLLTLFGVVLAGVSYYFLRDEHRTSALIAIGVTLLESVILGFVLGAKRALVAAMAHGLTSLGLGRSLVGLVFERMGVGRGLEKLPLAQSEELLSRAVRTVTGDAAQTGWLRRTIQGRLLEATRTYTLARFRQEGAKHGGVDLQKINEELEQTVDDVIIHKVRAGIRIWTALAVLGLASLVAAQTFLILLLLRAQQP